MVWMILLYEVILNRAFWFGEDYFTFIIIIILKIMRGNNDVVKIYDTNRYYVSVENY